LFIDGNTPQRRKERKGDGSLIIDRWLQPSGFWLLPSAFRILYSVFCIVILSPFPAASRRHYAAG
jgi:hypothetical protein